MMIRFFKVAQKELDKVFEYYEFESPGQGYDFLSEINDSLSRIKKYPKSGVLLKNNKRRCQTKRFPYGIIYKIKEKEIVIVAIAHLHRKPYYWINRYH